MRTSCVLKSRGGRLVVVEEKGVFWWGKSKFTIGWRAKIRVRMRFSYQLPISLESCIHCRRVADLTSNKVDNFVCSSYSVDDKAAEGKDHKMVSESVTGTFDPCTRDSYIQASNGLNTDPPCHSMAVCLLSFNTFDQQC